MFSTLLVANRGEIAVRILRTCRELGVKSVAVYSDADRGAPHVGLADVAVRLGPAEPEASYLDIARLIEVARETGAEAVHPGYGFLAERAAFARALDEAGIVFVGPTAGAIEAMGDKLAARRTAASVGIPVLPGSDPNADMDGLLREAPRVGFPLLVKAAGGGGGRGMRRVSRQEDLAAALEAASREAGAAFADPRVYLERALDRARHIEVQVLADQHGNVVHLFERECSVQRRFQKILEEAPAPGLAPELRDALTEAAVRAARTIGYRGAGSVEFLVRGDEWFFLEMNTRLQVEHPVTEMVCGVDLVRAQIEIAAGERLGFAQSDLQLRGHAIEARVCAEDPERGFIPSPGEISLFVEPAGPGVRCDSGVVTGGRVPAEYDSLIAKVIAHHQDRPSALVRLERALEDTAVLGVASNVGYLLDLLEDPAVVSGQVDTQLLERRAASRSGTRTPSADAQDAALVAAALATLRQRRAPSNASGIESEASAAASPWDSLDGWRSGETRS